MRIANLKGRAVIITGEGTQAVDIETASGGRFGDPATLYDDWADFREWAAAADLPEGEPFDETDLLAPSPRPRQILAIGLNYADHADESGFDAPKDLPPVFPKFVSSLTGPITTVVLPAGGKTDGEVELVTIIGKEASHVAEADAWDHIAGVTVGNDISERVVQLRGPAPQFGLGKSFPGFTPTGPWLVTPDEFENPDDLAMTCTLDTEVVQSGRTGKLIAPVSRLIAELSAIITLYPGDLIFTGTPEGVGLGRTPQMFIQDGQVLVSRIDGIGELRQTFVAAGQGGRR